MIDPAELARDLKVFADPATEFTTNKNRESLRITMTRDGRERSYVVNLSTSEVIARHADGRRFLNLRALLASEEFVDIRSFRATQRRILESKKLATYIEPEGEVLSRNGHSTPLTLETFRKSITNRADIKHLSILLLDGPAGIGKTSLLERMVYERAEPASHLPPLLHVTSSGSRLTDLTKALAHATQILRSRVTFDQVPILARLGVLQVAIDGFDELVDPDGYKDAWSALRNFLAEVGTGGPVILSGRDTFFDQQSFEEKLASRIPHVELSHARLHPVSVNAAKRYLREHGWSDKDIKTAESREWLRPGSYHLRPFFLTQLGRKGGWKELAESNASPQSFLVTLFVKREANVISKMVEIRPDKAEEALWEFYGHIVEDMANQETDTVDESLLALACETAFQARVNDNDLSKLVFKAASFGLLESEGVGTLRKFPHSELQAQFLARVLVERLETSAAMAAFLRRGLVSTALMDAFSDVFDALPPERAGTIRTRLVRSIADEPFSERLVSNCGALLLSTISKEGIKPLELRSLSIVDAKIIGTAAPTKIIDVSFAHLDVRGADCRSVVFEDSTATTLTVNELTAFGLSRPSQVRALQIEDLGTIRTLRNPEEIEAWLEAHSIRPSDSKAQDAELPFVRYFDRLCRKFVRQHQIRANPNDEGYFLLEDPLWKEAEGILGNRVVVETKAARGPKSRFYRIVRPEALLSPGHDKESAKLRRRVIERARELAAKDA